MLDALRNQRDGQGRPFCRSKYEVLLLANNCTDETYRVAMDYQHAYPDFGLYVAECWFPPKTAHVGTARRLLMDEAWRRFTLLGYPNGIIASTDGDTEVDPTWVHHIVQEIQKGNDAVGGRILLASPHNQPGNYHALDETYRTLVVQTESILDPLHHDPWPCHFQYFGASLAVTCSMYEQAGGLPELPHLEDKAFYQALIFNDAKIRRSPEVKVITSGRHEGRVEIGLSEQLKKWAHMEQRSEPQLVAGAPEIISCFTHRQLIRTCWNDANMYAKYNTELLASLAGRINISPQWMQEELEKSRYFGQLWEKIEQQLQSGGWYKQWKPVMISDAIFDLQEFIRLHSCQEV